MILNFRNSGPLEHSFYGGTLFVDGREILQAYYIDAVAGQVKTYDIAGDGERPRLRTKEEIAAVITDPAIELLDSGLLSKTISGNVQLFWPDGRQAWPEIIRQDPQ